MNPTVPPSRHAKPGSLTALCCLLAWTLAGCDQPPTATAAETSGAWGESSADRAGALLYPERDPHRPGLLPVGTVELPDGPDTKRIVFVAAMRSDRADIGAVVFSGKDNRWRAETVQAKIGTIAPGRLEADHARVEHIDIGPSRVAFLVPDGTYDNGHSAWGSRVIAYSRGKFADLGFVKTGENNLASCADEEEAKTRRAEPCWESAGFITALPGTAPDYFDLKVSMLKLKMKRHGKQVAGDGIVAAADARCAFDGKAYRCHEDR